MNNFKWQYLVGEWIFLLPLESHLLRTDSGFTCRQYHYGGREASPTHTNDLQLAVLYTMSWVAEEPRNTSHIHSACSYYSHLSVCLSLLFLIFFFLANQTASSASMVLTALNWFVNLRPCSITSRSLVAAWLSESNKITAQI